MARRARFRITPIILITLVALIIAACGGGGDEQAPTSAPAPTATVAPGVTAPPTATATARPATATQPAATPAPTPFLGAVTATPTPATQQVKTGGVLRMRELLPFEPMDTWDLRSKFGALWLQNILSNLVRQDPTQPANIIPDLAERWTVSSDGRTITFSLRQGVKWHDGRALTASDIQFNFNRGKNPPIATVVANAQPLRLVESMSAVDAATFRVTLTRPSAFFIQGVAAPFFLIYPPHIGDVTANWRTNPIATGPFKMTDFKSPISARLTKYDAYHQKDEAGRALPYLDGIDYQFITDNTAALAAFRTGRLDCGCGSDFTTPQGDSIKRQQPEITVVEFSEDAIHFFFNNKPPWNDLNVRKAVHLSLNFPDINAVSRGGKGFYPPTFILAKELGGSWALPADEMRRYPGYRTPKDQDLAESRRLLQAAGVDPAKTKMKIQAIGFYRDFSEAFPTQLQRFGWNVELNINPSGAQLSQALLQGDFDLSFNGGGRAIDDPSDILLEYITTRGGSNYGKWSIPEIDRLADEQDRELDRAKRAQLIDQMQRLVLDNVIFMPALNIVTTKVLWPQVKGFFPGRYDVSSALRLERLWLDR
jgi:peptide/nickel transport system substrate-binding protein